MYGAFELALALSAHCGLRRGNPRQRAEPHLEPAQPALTVSQECKTDPTVSFINRPLQTGYGRNGVHELGNGPKLSIGDLGLPQIPAETEF